MAAAAILDDRKSLSIAFIAVCKLFHNIFTKWPPESNLIFPISPKSIGFFHSRSSMAVSNLNLICALAAAAAASRAKR